MQPLFTINTNAVINIFLESYNITVKLSVNETLGPLRFKFNNCNEQ